MAMDSVDAVAVFGCGAVAVGAIVLEWSAIAWAAIAGGLFLSLSLWRLSAGRIWEALGFLAWVGTAVALAVGGETVPGIAAFFGSMLVGLVLLFGGRFDRLPDVWTPEDGPVE